MKFRILGPLRVTGADGAPVRLEPRQRRVLAALLVGANRTVSRERLVEAAWDRPPPTAFRQIQNLVSALRRRVGGEIGADVAGYRIDLDRGQLDSLVFAETVARADAAAGLRAALALWEGPALAGLGGPVFEAAAAGLDERRLCAWERCAELEIAEGRHREVVHELVELVMTHPLRESLVGHLMVALHRSGRQADAVAAYLALRRRLVETLGIDPGPALRELYTALLRG